MKNIATACNGIGFLLLLLTVLVTERAECHADAGKDSTRRTVAPAYAGGRQTATTGVAHATDFTGGRQPIMDGTVKYVVRAKAVLEGAWNGVSAMRTDLRTAAVVPLAQPYNDATRWNYAGTESVVSVPAGVVDWVLVELRDAATPATIVARRAGFILADGTITDVDGATPVGFSTGAAGSYRVAIRHRNHIPVMSATAQALSLADGPAYDFSTGQGQAYGTSPMKQIAIGVFALYGGDATADAFIDGNDFNDADAHPWSSGYLLYDTNMDAFIDGNDFNIPDANPWQGSQLP